MNLGEKLSVVLLYIFIYVLLYKMVVSLIPWEKKGRFIDRLVFPLTGILILFVPPILIYRYLKEEYPILMELASFIVELVDLDDLVRALALSIFMAVLYYAIATFIWNLISLALRWFFGDLPLLGPILERLIIGLEVLAILSTLLVVPVYAISVFKEVDPYPVVISDPIVIPPGVDENVWEVIATGVRNAQANGVNCSPYLLQSLKIYETGTNFCDESWEGKSRPNGCASYAGALGMFQFLPETFARNAKRHGIEGSLWNPTVAAEVACYFIADEVKISLNQSRDVFVGEFSSIGFVWNKDPSGAGVVYDRAIKLREDAMSQAIEEDDENYPKGYIWPGPDNSYLWYEWGVQMWYGSYHNGIDIAVPGLGVFDVRAISNGTARYYDGGPCNMGIIHFKSVSHEQFYYVHMTTDESKIYIKTDGSWVPVFKGQKLGQIHSGDTTCSRGSHLHFMYTDGRRMNPDIFNR
jgi:hypothetical protein